MILSVEVVQFSPRTICTGLERESRAVCEFHSQQWPKSNKTVLYSDLSFRFHSLFVNNKNTMHRRERVYLEDKDAFKALLSPAFIFVLCVFSPAARFCILILILRPAALGEPWKIQPILIYACIFPCKTVLFFQIKNPFQFMSEIKSQINLPLRALMPSKVMRNAVPKKMSLPPKPFF